MARNRNRNRNRNVDAAAPLTVVVVGATSGLGRAVALQFAGRGHRVLAAGRDRGRAGSLLDELRRQPGPDPAAVAVDVATRDGQHQLADWVTRTTSRVDALVNNAGVMVPTRQLSADGHEMNLAVHHLAPFAVTGLLLGLLRAGAVPGDPDGRDRPRVVNVNSAGHQSSLGGHVNPTLDFTDLESERGYDPFLAYSRSKLANLLFTYELARRHGGELVVNALHPGVVRTDLGRSFPRLQVAAFLALATPPRRAAPHVICLAVEPVATNGAYYDTDRQVRSSSPSYDTAAAERLWDHTERITGVFAETR